MNNNAIVDENINNSKLVIFRPIRGFEKNIGEEEISEIQKEEIAKKKKRYKSQKLEEIEMKKPEENENENNTFSFIANNDNIILDSKPKKRKRKIDMDPGFGDDKQKVKEEIGLVDGVGALQTQEKRVENVNNVKLNFLERLLQRIYIIPSNEWIDGESIYWFVNLLTNLGKELSGSKETVEVCDNLRENILENKEDFKLKNTNDGDEIDFNIGIDEKGNISNSKIKRKENINSISADLFYLEESNDALDSAPEKF